MSTTELQNPSHPAHAIRVILGEEWRGLTGSRIAGSVMAAALLAQILEEGRSIPNDPARLRELANLLRVAPKFLQDLGKEYRKHGGTAPPATRAQRTESSNSRGRGRPPSRPAPAR